MIVETTAFLAVVLSVLVPGLLLSFALLHQTNTGKFDKAMVGIILGALVPPALGVVEYLAFGVRMSFWVVLLNCALASALGIALYYYQARRLPRYEFSWREEYRTEEHWVKFAKSNKTAILLGLVIAFGFYGRYATSADPYFSEIDPYYYMRLTQYVATDGFIPLATDMAYFPQVRSNPAPPLIHYAVAGWFLIYQGITGVSYSRDLLIAFNQLYPPLAGALLSYLGYLLVRQEADRRIALMAAALYAFTPQLVQKMAAGVAEQQPYGLFASILVLTFYLVAVKRKSLRWGALAGLALFLLMIGSMQYIWPVAVLSAFIAVSALLEYWVGEMDGRTLAINWMAVAGAFAGAVTQQINMQQPVFGLPPGILVMVFSALPGTLLFFMAKYNLAGALLGASSSPETDKKLTLGAMFLLASLGLLFTPLGERLGSYATSTMGFAKPNTAIMMTVAEEAPASDAFDYSSYGFFSRALSPKNLLMLSAMLSFAIMLVTLLNKKRKWLFWGSLALFSFIFVFNQAFDSFMISALGGFGGAQIAENLGKTDIFYYMGLAVASTSVTYLFADKKNKLPLLFILIFFPISFIGLSKLKYIAHLATALPVAVAFVLFSVWELVGVLSDYLKPSGEHALERYGHGAVLFCAFLFSFFQFAHAAGSPVVVACDSSGWGKSLNQFSSQISIPWYSAPSAIGSLCYSRIDYEWRDAMGWMSLNLNDTDRVLSWWDYGHWTTFYGGKKTALDPGNGYPKYNQMTARALVNGPRGELVRVMRYFHTDYLMLDNELIQKWGALNFLGGTFAGLSHEPDPADNFNVTPAIDWTKGPGGSEWEFEHAYEFIYTVYSASQTGGQPQRANCPGIIPRQAMYSALTGTLYCASPGQAEINLFALKGASGEQVPLKDPQLVRIGSDAQVSLEPLGNSGLYINTAPGASPFMLNLNPDLYTLSNGTRTSKLFNAPFVQLFFLEKLEGFELAHKTPSGKVKIFRLVS